MSYCSTASCLRHRRKMYFDLQQREWVHLDGWTCDEDDAMCSHGPHERGSAPSVCDGCR